MKTVTLSHRVEANRKVRGLRATNRYVDAEVLETAIIWESFPASYTAMQAELGAALLTSEYGSENYHNIATTIYLIINDK